MRMHSFISFETDYIYVPPNPYLTYTLRLKTLTNCLENIATLLKKLYILSRGLWPHTKNREGIMSFLEKVEEKVVPIAAKFGAHKHLVAIRDGFASIMPLIMVGAFAALFNNVFFNASPGFNEAGELTGYPALIPQLLFDGGVKLPGFFNWTTEHLVPLFGAMERGTMAIMALGVAVAISYIRANDEDIDPLAASLVGLSTMFVLDVATRNYEGMQPVWQSNWFGSNGIFVAVVSSLLGFEIFKFITKKGWTIKMPEQVPPAVARGFAAIIPAFVVAFAFALVHRILGYADYTGLFEFVERTIASGLANMTQSLPAVLISTFLVSFFWFFGLHGANMMAAFFAVTYDKYTFDNVAEFSANGKDGSFYTWTKASWDAYVHSGGSAGTLMLIVAIFIFSKSKSDKEIAKLSVAPGIFEINEPVIFGLPIVLNPIMFIPFVFGPLTAATFAFIMTEVGFAGPIVNAVPWTTPPIINVVLATNGSIGALITQLICMGILFAWYLPFVFISNSVANKAENK